MDNTHIFACKMAAELIIAKLEEADSLSRLNGNLAGSKDCAKSQREVAAQLDAQIGEILEIAKNLSLILNGYHPEG